MRIVLAVLLIAFCCAVFGGLIGLLVWALNGNKRKPAAIVAGAFAAVPFLFLTVVVTSVSAINAGRP